MVSSYHFVDASNAKIGLTTSATRKFCARSTRLIINDIIANGLLDIV